MRVLLNATSAEVRFIGGDYTYYRTLLALDRHVPNWQANLLVHTSQRQRTRVRQLEVLATHSPLAGPRRWLFAQARRVPISIQDITEFQADVVFSTVLSARLPRNAHVAQVWYSQGISPAEYYDYFGGVTIEDVASLYRRLASHVSLIVIGTHDCRSRLLELCDGLPCPVMVVPQVTLLEPLASLGLKPDEPVRFLFVGRDYRRKGLAEVLEAYRRIRRRTDAMELDVVTTADCPLHADYANVAGINWHSDLSDELLRGLYEQAHVLVVPTWADTYNMVMVEAMAYGCAIISSDLPPLGEIAPHDDVGLLIPRGDVDALANAMESLVQEEALRQRYGNAALTRYKSLYAPEVVVPQLLAAFERAMVLT